MCIIAYKPKGVRITPETLMICYRNNPDGAGFMYPCEGRLLIKKGFFTFSDFAAAWEKTHKIHGNRLPVVFHFRIATSGKIDKTNCHPHRIAPDLAFVHNGVLSCVQPPQNSRVSDTVMYRDRHLKKFTGETLRDTRLMRTIARHIGRDNKFVFLNGKGRAAILNEDRGQWESGIWYSNGSFRERGRFDAAFDEGCCENCGNLLCDPEELALGYCLDCLMNDFDLYRECAVCGQPLVTSAHREAGCCDDCGAEIYGNDWKKTLKEFSKSAGSRDVPF